MTMLSALNLDWAPVYFFDSSHTLTILTTNLHQLIENVIDNTK